MKKNCFFLLVMFAGLSAFSQTTNVRSCKGIAFISGDISPNQAKNLALVDAKINALKQAGVDEKLNSCQVLFTSEVKNEYSQFFSSDIQSEMQGAIKSYSILSEKIYCKNEVEIICEITIDATVIKYDAKPDPAFDLKVEGIKPMYSSGDNLNFDIKASQNGYLTIFNITDTEATQLYPNEFETQSKLDKLKAYKFPVAKIDYTLGSGLKKQETDRLIFVLTKNPIPFIKMNKDQVTSNESIFAWIYSIPPDQRKVEYFSFSVQK
jgi:hypothetical protein